MKIKKRLIRRARIEMVPLIDSIFLILVFFIYAFLSMTVHKGLPINLPSAMAALIDKADYCAITVSEDNTYFLNKEPVSIDEMGGRLRTMIIGNPDLRVYLNGDKNAHHGSVVAVLDRLRAAGFEKISIETNAEEAANE